MTDKTEEKALAAVEPIPAIVPIDAKTGSFVPGNLDGLYRLSSCMAKSGLMPKGITSPEQVFVCVQMGLEVGLSPMQAVQNIAPINGRPSIWGDAQLALVRSSGLLDDFEEFYEGTYPNEDFKAVCVAKRKGQKKPIRDEFTLGDAKAAGLLAKGGVWKSYPKRMLKMRPRSWVLRDGFGDVLKGVPQAEEAMDYDMDLQLDKKNGSYHPVEIDTSEFDALLADTKDFDKESFDKFLELTAGGNEISVPKLKLEAVKNFEEFWAGYENWLKINAPTKKAEPSEDVQDGPEPEGLPSIAEMRKELSAAMEAEDIALVDAMHETGDSNVPVKKEKVEVLYSAYLKNKQNEKEAA